MSSYFDALRDQYGDRLSVLICQEVKHNDCCHDILQEVYLKMFEKAEQIKEATDVFPYLKKITGNTIADHYRRQARSKIVVAPSLESIAVVASNDPAAQNPLSDSFLWQMIEALPSMYRVPLILNEIKGISQKDIALQMGISYSGIRSRIQRAKKMLQKCIQACCNYQFDRYGNVVSCCGEDCC